MFQPLAQLFSDVEDLYSLIDFYGEIVGMQVESRKNKPGVQALTDENNLVCRDTLPRHVLLDMLSFARKRLASFEEAYSSDQALITAYGLSEESIERAEIEQELSVLVCLIEMWGQVACFGSDWFKFTMVDIGMLEYTLDLLYTLKVMVDSLDRMGIFEMWKLRREEPQASAHYFEDPTSTNHQSAEETKQQEQQPLIKLTKHPFGGYLSKLVSLVCSLTFRMNQRVEDYLLSPDGKLRLGAILSHTKMDVDNPMLREWSLVAIRNLCSWSANIREDLSKLQLIEMNEQGKEQLEQLGVKELFEREIAKLKKKDANGNVTQMYENHNIHFDTVDF